MRDQPLADAELEPSSRPTAIQRVVGPLALSLAACHGGSTADGLDDGIPPFAVDAGGAEGIDDVLYVSIEPPEVLLELDLGQPASQSFTATVVFGDGTSIDATERVTWRISEPGIGELRGPSLEVESSQEGEITTAIVTAEYAGRAGQAQVTLARYDFEEDFFFVLPLDGDTQAKPLTFSTGIKSMDVFINMDTTASMEGALTNLQAAMAAQIVPEIQAQIPDTRFGAGTFQDFPVAPYGIAGLDQPFTLYRAITDDTDAVRDALTSFTMGDGGDPPESIFEALYQIATGEGLEAPPPTFVQPHAGGIGGVGFREGALPVVVSITNAIGHDPHDGGCGRAYLGGVASAAHGREDAIAALDQICARAVQISLSSGSCGATTDGAAMAEGTGAVIPPAAWDLVGRPASCQPGQCCTSLSGFGVSPNAEGMCPVSYQAQQNGTGVDESFIAAVQLVAAYEQFDVTREIHGDSSDQRGEPLPGGTTSADFIQAVTPIGHGPVPLPGIADPGLRPTWFEDVIPDTDVIFEVRARNDFVEQGPLPRLFVVEIEVLADQCHPLDTREVFILVPPAELPPVG